MPKALQLRRGRGRVCISLAPTLLKLLRVSESLRGLDKARFAGPHPEHFKLVSLDWGLGICISNAFLSC